MVKIGKLAWFVLMNRKFRTAAFRSPGQTRPQLLRGCRAPPEAICSHAGAATTRHVRQHSGRVTHPPVGPLFCLPARSSCGSTGRSDRTPARDRRGGGQREPVLPSDDGTQVNTVVGFWPWSAPLEKASGCPPNRGNPNRHAGLHGVFDQPDLSSGSIAPPAVGGDDDFNAVDRLGHGRASRLQPRPSRLRHLFGRIGGSVSLLERLGPRN